MGIHISEYVGQRIKVIRKRKKYTQEQLGEKVGLPQPYIGGIERGERNISLDTLERILEALECSPSNFFRHFKDGDYSEAERVREAVLDDINELLAKRSVHEIQMIQQLACNILSTIDSYMKEDKK